MGQQAVTADDGRLFFAALALAQDWYLAVGTGDGITPPDKTAHGLVAEIGRKLVLQKFFVVEDPIGVLGPIDTKRYTVSLEATNLVYLLFRFDDDEAVGDWSEAGLFTGDVAFVTRQAVILDGPQAGDDRANGAVVVGGSYTTDENQTLTVTVTTGGASGIAMVGWASNGSEPPGSALVTFLTPVVLGGTGLTLVFSGGVDGVLTQGDQWRIQCTAAPASPDFAADGLYDPVGNQAGQVLANGKLFKLYHQDPPISKGVATVNVPIVTKVLNNG